MDRTPGVYGVDIEVDNRDITVHYDSARATVEQILGALEAAGESAKPRQ